MAKFALHHQLMHFRDISTRMCLFYQSSFFGAFFCAPSMSKKEIPLSPGKKLIEMVNPSRLYQT